MIYIQRRDQNPEQGLSIYHNGSWCQTEQVDSKIMLCSVLEEI